MTKTRAKYCHPLPGQITGRISVKMAMNGRIKRNKAGNADLIVALGMRGGLLHPHDKAATICNRDAVKGQFLN